MEECDDFIKSNLKKNNRKEKKIFKKIRNQMYFYFSDSNITKDKFLLDLIKKNKDGFVDLEVFRSFNKIKALSQCVEDICIALSKSDILQISDDGKKVRRILPLPEPKDFDSCTIYVEKLPSNADQKWLRDVFERFGSVDHINIPHFKISGKIKGFAFVEFSSSEAVNKACEWFKSLSNEENEHTNDETKDKKTVKRKKHDTMQYRKSQDIKNAKMRKKCSSDTTASKKEEKSSLQLSDDEFVPETGALENKLCTADNLASPVKETNKRKRSQGGEGDGTPKKFKSCAKSEKGCDNEARVDIDNQPYLNFPETKDSAVTLEEKMSQEKKVLCDEMQTTSHRRKRHTKNRASNSIHLRVMKKCEWKAYRNKFLALQRATTAHLKKAIAVEAQHLCPPEVVKSSLQFVPGAIIKVTLPDPIVSSTGIKSQVKSQTNVAYIDALVGLSEAYIRCHNSEDAATIINEKKLHHLGSLEILKDADEKRYWDKLENDRKIKLNSNEHKKRGRDKICAKAVKLVEQRNKHMYFDD